MKNKDIEKLLKKDLNDVCPDVWDRIKTETGYTEEKETELVPLAVAEGASSSYSNRKAYNNKVAAFSLAILAVIMAAVLIIVMCLPRGGIPPIINYSSVGYIVLDINPSVEIVIDQNGRTTAVKPLNEDARSLLINKSGFIGKTGEQAAAMILELTMQQGYVSPAKKNNAVLVSAQLDDAASGKMLAENVKNTLLSEARTRGVYCAVLTDAGGQSVRAQAESYGITESKMRLINSAIAAGVEFTDEQIRTISVAEIYAAMETVKDETEEELENLEEELEEELEELGERIEEIIESLSDKLDDIDQAEEAIERLTDMCEEIEDVKNNDALDILLSNIKDGLTDLADILDENLYNELMIADIAAQIDEAAAKYAAVNERLEQRIDELILRQTNREASYRDDYERHTKSEDFDDDFEDWLERELEIIAADWEAYKNQWSASLDD